VTIPDFSYEFDRILLDRQAKEVAERTKRVLGRYYPSEIPACLRQTFYSYYNPKPKPAKTLRVFEAGDMAHEWVKKMLTALVEAKQIHGEIASLENERPFTIVVDQDEDISIEGRFDDFLMLSNDRERYLIDAKSQKSLYYTNEFKKEHAIQIMPYIYIKRPCKGLIAYVDRATYETKFLPQAPTEGIDYDKEIMNWIFTRTKLLHKYIVTHTMPPPEAKQVKDMNWMCNPAICPWRAECDAAEATKDKWIKPQ